MLTAMTSASELRERLQSVLGDAYRVDRELGGGGMSRVFVVVDESLGRQIIVKVLSPELAEGVSLERFAREIRTLAQLQHPHIVPVLNAGRVDDLPYYAMPYVTGDSARVLLRKQGTLSIHDAVSILRDVAKALEFAHREGVVHRDIKPDNILISGNAAVVSDFGIAKAVNSARSPGQTGTLTSVGVSIGTPAYMSPEQALAEPDVDLRADIYSFGVTAYELLTGALPFGDRPSQAMIRAHISETPPDVRTKRSDVPEPLARLVMQCLEKDPPKRPASASELLATLEDVSGTHGRPQVSRRRTPLLVGAAAIVVIAALIGWRVRSAKSGTPPPAVAVLPFENLSRDTASEYFGDGMTEQLVSDLSRANGLRVASRAASFAYKGKHIDPREAAAALHVDAIVIGSVRRAGDQLRIEAQLVDKNGGSPRWSQRFDRTRDDAFAVQEEIARAITSALKVSLAPTRTQGRATDGVAYDQYLRALHAVRGRRTRANLEMAIAELQASIERDSTFAPAWGALAEAYRLMSEFVAPSTVLPRAKEAARRAVELDPSDPSAALALADIIFNVDWNWPAAEREYRRASSLQPESPAVHRAYSAFLQASRRYDESLDQAQRADTLEWRQFTDTVGLRARQMSVVAGKRAAMGQREQARRMFDEALRLAPQSWLTRWAYGLALIAWDPQGAVAQLEQVRAMIGNQTPQITHLGVAYGLSGRPDSTRRIIAELLSRSRTSYVPKDQLCVLYLSIGERETGLKWLRQAIEEHHYWLPYLNGSTLTEPLRGDREYRGLLKRIGVPGAAL